MAEKKITKRERFEQIKALLADHEELVEFIDHEIELISRKSSKSAKEPPAQRDAAAVAEIIKDILAECVEPNGMTVGAILKDERIKAYTRANGDPVSSQMVTSIFTKNPKDFVNTKSGKTSLYRLAYGVEGEEEEG